MMPLPKFSPLQSRLAASLVACVLVLLLYLTLSSSHFAYALDVDSITPEDHNHERLLMPYLLDDEIDDSDQLEVHYKPDFFGFDRSIIGRAPSWVDATIFNNDPYQDNIQQGDVHYYMFANSSVWGTPAGPSKGLPPSYLRQKRGPDSEDYLDTSAVVVSDSTAQLNTYERKDTSDLKLLSKKLQARTVHITINTCLQPFDPTGTQGAPPQLRVYVSQSAQGQMSTAGKLDNGWQDGQVVEAVGGFANITVQASGDVFIAVYAPSAEGFINPYNVEVAASIDAPFHSYNNTQPNLYLVDSDSSSALLVTNNLTTTTNGSLYDTWISLAPPFVIFASNKNISDFSGIQNSYCGLEKYAQIAGTTGGVRNSAVQTSMTNVTSGPFPKQQFYFQGLNGSSSYYGILAMTGNSTASGKDVVGGGGQVWQAMNFQTQSDGNCAVIFNLSFCNSVAYAVPANPTRFSITNLTNFYDTAAQAAYNNFYRNLQQIPCEIDSTGQYSLARTCKDCQNAYKSWLCSVMIPRCMDFSSTASYLQERNIVQPFPNQTTTDAARIKQVQNILYLNSSRNPTIDSVVAPGPYKELLPCDDLCYGIVQSCPAAMGFACPLPGQLGFNYSYGVRQAGNLTCNYPGAVYNMNGVFGRELPFTTAVAIFTLLSLYLV